MTLFVDLKKLFFKHLLNILIKNIFRLYNEINKSSLVKGRPVRLCAPEGRPPPGTTWPTCLWARRARWGSWPRPRWGCTGCPRAWCPPSAPSPPSRRRWTARSRCCRPGSPSPASVSSRGLHLHSHSYQEYFSTITLLNISHAFLLREALLGL